MSKVDDTKVEGALIKLNVISLAIRGLAQQDVDVASDLYSLLGMVEEVKDELEQAVRGEP